MKATIDPQGELLTISRKPPSFPAKPIQEWGPTFFARSTSSNEPIVAVFRYTVAKGREALIHFSYTMLATAFIGPVPDAQLVCYAVAANIPDGSFTALSERERSALSSPIALRQTAGAVPTPFIYSSIGNYFPLVRSLAIPEGIKLLAVVKWPSTSLATINTYGFLHGWSWQKDTLSPAEKLLLTYRADPR